jgi:hypothetical protein
MRLAPDEIGGGDFNILTTRKGLNNFYVWFQIVFKADFDIQNVIGV